MKALLTFLLLGGTAFADSLTITLTTPTGICASGCTKTFSDASSAKPNTLETNIVQVWQNPCNVSINGTCTAGQVLNYWAGALRDDFVAQVNAYQLQQLQSAVTYVPINPQ